MVVKKPMVVAIDGPAASGKGSLGRLLADHYGWVYLDTGKLYRAVGKKLLDSRTSLEEAENTDSPAAQTAETLAKSLTFEDIDTEELGTEEVGRAASIASAIPGVRKALLAFQRSIAASPEGALLDGRDIGTVICPDADLKFFITATVEKRAERRYKQLQNQNNSVIYDDVLRDLKERDARDAKRSIAPMKPADNAIVIDTSDMALENVFQHVVEVIDATTS